MLQVKNFTEVQEHKCNNSMFLKYQKLKHWLCEMAQVRVSYHIYISGLLSLMHLYVLYFILKYNILVNVLRMRYVVCK